MKRIIRWLALVMLLVAAQAGAQQYMSENDGRNWNSWGRDFKGGFVMGMMLHEHAIWLFLEASNEYDPEFVSEDLLRLVDSLDGPDNEKVRDIIDKLDEYYSYAYNHTKLLWKAYYLCRGILLWTGDKP